MGDSRITGTKALRLAVKLLVMIVLCLGPYAQSANAGTAVQAGTAGHHAQLSVGAVPDHHAAHAGHDSGSGSTESSGNLDADAHGNFASCCELFCVGSALLIAYVDLPVLIPSAMIHSHKDAGVGLGEWLAPHRPPQRLI